MHPTPAASGKAALFSGLDIRLARTEDLDALAWLTPQNLRTVLAEGTVQKSDAASPCNLVAWVDEVPAGLLISRPHPERPWTQDILSLMVTPLFRRQGLARALLQALVERIKPLGRKECSASWSDRLPQLDSLRALLSSEGWQHPEQSRLRMSFNVGEREDALRAFQPLIAAARRRGLRSFALAEAGADAPARIASAATFFTRAGSLPAWATPAPWLERCDPVMSQLLLDGEGRLCGWLLCEHQPAFHRWAIPIGWCATGPGHMLLAMEAALAALEQHAGSGATVILQPSERNGHKVCTLLDRHFRPYALWADRLVVSRKPI
jgi:GNAT superfamily N-acetyltransferase